MSANNVLCWTDIPVTDLERAMRFYAAVLAQEVTKQSGPGFEFGLLPHVNDGVSGCLAVMPDNKPSEAGPLIYLSVDGRLDEAILAVTANGGRVVRERHPIGPHGHRAVIVDSEGNRLALHSTK